MHLYIVSGLGNKLLAALRALIIVACMAKAFASAILPKSSKFLSAIAFFQRLQIFIRLRRPSRHKDEKFLTPYAPWLHATKPVFASIQQMQSDFKLLPLL